MPHEAEQAAPLVCCQATLPGGLIEFVARVRRRCLWRAGELEQPAGPEMGGKFVKVSRAVALDGAPFLGVAGSVL